MATTFDAALHRVKGADTTKAHVYLPVRALREDRCQGLIDALRGFREALGAESAV